MADPAVNAVEVQGLVKRFGDFAAVNGLDLTIRRGELLSLLGPNGAGKSTTLRMLTTLMPATEGRIEIAGYQVPRDKERIKPLLGLVPQEIALYRWLSPRFNLSFFGKLYGITGEKGQQRVRTLLEQVELADKADQPIITLSGGMQRRVNIAAALVHDPDIIFLDEPTVGLDPITRSAIWKIIQDLKARGKTLVLTTHYMEEAEALSDRVAIVDHGRVVAIGSPSELVQATGIQTALNITVKGEASTGLEPLRALPGVKQVTAEGSELRVYAASGSEALPLLMQTLVRAGIEVRSVEVLEPNLEAVFLHYTGRRLRE